MKCVHYFFSVVSVCLSIQGECLHITIIHDSIGQLQVSQAPPPTHAPTTTRPPHHTKTTSPWSPYHMRNPQNVQTCSLGPHCTDTLRMCSHCPTLTPTQTSIKNGLYRIVWRCSHCTNTTMPSSTVTICRNWGRCRCQCRAVRMRHYSDRFKLVHLMKYGRLAFNWNAFLFSGAKVRSVETVKIPMYPVQLVTTSSQASRTTSQLPNWNQRSELVGSYSL